MDHGTYFQFPGHHGMPEAGKVLLGKSALCHGYIHYTAAEQAAGKLKETEKGKKR